ncbi:MAG: hypothetical protein Q8O82_02140 [Pseudorhodobacter sp.]|nr:hypothetical protein [Pseudorhodobacter sp.]
MQIRRRVALWICPELGTGAAPATAPVTHTAILIDGQALILLAATLAAHTGRSEFTIAKWCGVHARLLYRLRKGEGCRVDTFNHAMRAISDRWPSDLEWPRAIPRPGKSMEAA